jgi:hypothetical protein
VCVSRGLPAHPDKGRPRNDESFKGSDRKRLRALDDALGDSDHDAWMVLGDAREDGFARWKSLLG